MPREQRPNQIGVSFLMDKKEHEKVTQKAKDYGFESLAAYFKFTALNAEIKVKVKTPEH
jgi:hypothetical protein